MVKVDGLGKQIAGLRYDNRSLFDLVENIEKKMDRLNGAEVIQNHREVQCLIGRSILKTICDDDELQEVDMKLISSELSEFRTMFVS